MKCLAKDLYSHLEIFFSSQKFLSACGYLIFHLIETSLICLIAQAKRYRSSRSGGSRRVQKIRALREKLVAFIRSLKVEVDCGSRGSLQGPSIVSIHIPDFFLPLFLVLKIRLAVQSTMRAGAPR